MKGKPNAVIYMLLLLALCSCNDDKEITRLLNSELKEEVILGAYKAGETGDAKFIPLLLKDANDVRASAHKQFMGYNVYEEKMMALGKIFKQEPPVKLIDKPDSAIIKFYTALAGKSIK